MDRASEMGMFVRVVSEGSFSKAARTLGLTPSTVSKQISRMEDRLSVRLINRTTRQLALTEEGRSFHERCVRILNDIDEAEEAITALKATAKGTLRVNSTVALATHQIFPLMPEFTELFPDLKVDFFLTGRDVDLVDEHLDVSIRLGQPQDSSLTARRLAVAKWVVCASPGYLERNGIPEEPEELLDHNCLALTTHHGAGRTWEFNGPAGNISVRVGGQYDINHGDAVYDATIAGLGIARLPNYIVGADILTGRLVPLFNDYIQEEEPIYALYPHRRHLSAKVRAFVDFLVEEFSGEAPWEYEPARPL